MFFLVSSSGDYKMWQQLGKRRNPDAWEMYPSMVNAYFNPPANEVSILLLHKDVLLIPTF